jgi:trehalose 6-phosphate synthase/phosphatase
VPLALTPERAVPDDELLALLRRLSLAPGVQLEIVSGRPRHVLEAWFGDMPISLWAEHGFWHRPQPGAAWRPAGHAAPEWASGILPVLEQFAASTPGARIETKTASIAWHYRGAQPEVGERQAEALRVQLAECVRNEPLDVLKGKKVIEVRRHGATKAAAANHAYADSGPEIAIVAIGDDLTDEELFSSLPPSSITVAVGRRSPSARFLVDDHQSVRQILRSLVPDDGLPPGGP